MGYTAIVLDEYSAKLVRQLGTLLGLIPDDWKVSCHHVTLHLGAMEDDEFVGDNQKMRLTHFGKTEGRVSAFKVSGVEVASGVPHVTVAIANGAKPKESKDIAEWVPLPKGLQHNISGALDFCE